MALVLPTATTLNRRQHPASEGSQPRWPVRPAYWAKMGISVQDDGRAGIDRRVFLWEYRT